MRWPVLCPHWLLGVSFALLYVATAFGRPLSDDLYYYELIGNFLERGEWTMHPQRGSPALELHAAFMKAGVDGRIYLTLPTGLPLLTLPLAWLGMHLGGPELDFRWSTAVAPAPGVTFWAGLSVPVAMAIMLIAFSKLVGDSSGDRARGRAAALLLGLSTPCWFYATSFWTQAVVCSCMIVALARLRSPRARLVDAVLAGIALGVALMVRYDSVIFVPLVAAYGAWRFARQPGTIVAILAPVVVAGLALLWWNQLRFASPWQTGSIHQGWESFALSAAPRRILDMTLGGERGLFWYAPPLWLGLWSWPAAWRRDPALMRCIAAVVISYLLFYGSFIVAGEVGAPVAWGSRFLFPVVPLLLLPAFLSGGASPLASVLGRVLGLVGVILSLVGLAQRGQVAAPLWWLESWTTAAWGAVLLVASGLAFWTWWRAEQAGQA